MGHHHHHHHDHDHHHPEPHDHHADASRALGQAFALNGAFLAIEAVAGWWTGSLALLSDAAHMVSDVGALAIALAAARLAGRPSDLAATFGLRRAEVLGAALNGVALLLATAWIAVEATRRLAGGAPEIAGWPMLAVAAVGLAVNLGSALALWRSGADDLNVRAALAHMLADALGSVGAVVAAVAVLAGFPAADPLVSLFVAALVGWGGVDVLVRAGRVLLELPPAGFDVGRARAALLAVPGATGVHDLRVWSLDGRTPIVSAHLVAAADRDLDAIRAEADRGLHALGVHDLTLQVERAVGAPCCRRDGHPPGTMPA